MTEDQLPRERLLEKGPSALSDGELLAILLRTGTPGLDVIHLSQEILDSFGGVRGLLRASVREFMSFKGVGSAKATALAAAVEFGRRLSVVSDCGTDRGDWRNEIDRVRIFLAEEEREFIVGLFLDDRNRVISRERLSYGGPDGASLDLRHFLRSAVRLDARGFVMIHNHPDGSLVSSLEDKTLTRIVRSRMDVLGMDFHGHYIVSRRGVASVEE